ncbi:AlpA family phage regulatory protein [Prochlorococcus sp. AH-716-I19]|nr:AlpA family phage regulatory protein [Prochlorococcus sp. AH-716-I19]
MSNQENRPFLTIKEVSNLLGISTSTINRLIINGDFPNKIKLSPRRIVFMKNDIEDWIKTKENNK